MVNNLSLGTLSQSVPLKFHILLDHSREKQITASFLELPSCQVEAATPEQAIEELKNLLQTRMEKLEIIPVEIQGQITKRIENPGTKFAGVFQDDLDFAEIAESLRNERLANDDEDEKEQD